MLAAGLSWIALVGPADAQRKADVVRTIDGDEVYELLPPDRIPAIRDPEFVTGTDADRQMLPHETRARGWLSGDEARAYSLWQLDAHEIVNDRIGGTAFRRHLVTPLPFGCPCTPAA